jgi:hypothetical protein
MKQSEIKEWFESRMDYIPKSFKLNPWTFIPDSGIFIESCLCRLSSGCKRERDNCLDDLKTLKQIIENVQRNERSDV